MAPALEQPDDGRPLRRRQVVAGTPLFTVRDIRPFDAEDLAQTLRGAFEDIAATHGSSVGGLGSVRRDREQGTDDGDSRQETANIGSRIPLRIERLFFYPVFV